MRPMLTLIFGANRASLLSGQSLFLLIGRSSHRSPPRTTEATADIHGHRKLLVDVLGHLFVSCCDFAILRRGLPGIVRKVGTVAGGLSRHGRLHCRTT
jgi:hypothetical protein